MKAVTRGLDSFIEAMFGTLDKTGKVWARVGAIVLAVAAAMSYDFGSQVSFKHGLFLAGLTFVAAFGPEVAYKAYEEGKKGSSAAIALFAVLLLSIEFLSHQSYTAGIRGDNIATTKVQNAKYETAGAAVDEDKGALKEAREQLRQLKLVHPWAETTTADALRAQLPAIEVALKREANNCGRRKCPTEDAGKGPEWQKLAKQKADIEAKIATAEDRNGIAIRIADLEKRLEGRREKAEHTEYRSSAVVHSNQSIADLVAFVKSFGSDLTPSENVEKGSQIGINLGMALAGTGVPAFAFFVAGLYRTRRRESDFTNGRPEAHSEPAPTLSTEPAYASPSITMPAARTATAPQQHRHMVVKATTNTIADLRRTLQGIGNQPAYGTM